MKTFILCAGGIILLFVWAAFAAENATVSLPGLEIRADGSISAPGVEIGSDGSVRTPGTATGQGKVDAPGVSIDGKGRVATPGVVIETGRDGGEGDVTITSEGGNINTSVSRQNLFIKGDHNTVNGAGHVLTLRVQGNKNSIELRDKVDRIVFNGDDNFVKFPKGDTLMEDTGKGNFFEKR